MDLLSGREQKCTQNRCCWPRIWWEVIRNGNPLQYSCLENSMDWGAWWATFHGVTKTRLSDFTSLSKMPEERKSAPAFRLYFCQTSVQVDASRHWQILPSCCFPPPGPGSESGLPSWDQCHWTGNELILPPCAPRIVLTPPHGTKQQGSRRRRD